MVSLLLLNRMFEFLPLLFKKHDKPNSSVVGAVKGGPSLGFPSSDVVEQSDKLRYICIFGFLRPMNVFE